MCYGEGSKTFSSQVSLLKTPRTTLELFQIKLLGSGEFGYPKFSFCLWLAVHDRLPTAYRMAKWQGGPSMACVFCHHSSESRDHLFFACGFVSEIWAALAKGILKSRYTVDWNSLVTYVSQLQSTRLERFIAKYLFQATVYNVWRERNGRRHGEDPIPASRLIRMIDKQVRNKFSSLRASGDRRYDKGLQLWFESKS